MNRMEIRFVARCEPQYPESMKYRLYNGSDAFGWHARRWPQFSGLSEPESNLIIQPVYSITEWGTDFPLDSEEVVGSALLDAALLKAGADFRVQVLPPLRYTPELSPATRFGLDVEVAHRVLEETLTSAALTGYRRFVLFNTSPLLEEWIDVAGRDLRVVHDLQMFCVNLSGLGLDFHPLRGGQRVGLRALLEHLLGGPPIGDEASEEIALSTLDPLAEAAVKTSPPRGQTPGGGNAVLAEAAAELVGLLAEICDHPALPVAAPDAEADR
jgi:creatinine amidohydrolase